MHYLSLENTFVIMKKAISLNILMLLLTIQVLGRDCAPNKNNQHFNVLHYALVLKFDTATAHITGNVTMKAVCTATPKNELEVSLQEPMMMERVVSNQQMLKFRKKDEKYYISHPNLRIGDTFSITMYYSGIPRMAENAPWQGGLVKSRDAQGRSWLAMACQAEGASLWFPCKDMLSDEPEEGVELYYTVPEGVVAVGNGRLINVRPVADKHNLWHWRVQAPINLYNITFNIGHFIRIQEEMKSKAGILNLDYYVMSENFTKARAHFATVPEMISIFEDWLGAYPFFNDGFKLVETPYLGMEHQSAVAYGNQYQNGYMGKDRSGSGVGLLFDFILVHESAHEWFGNNISVNDPAYYWIHEGFTSYAEVLYIESKHGRQQAMNYLIGTRKLIQNKAPMQGTQKHLCSNDNSDIYPKGAQLVHLIRLMMQNDETFKQMLKDLNNVFSRKVCSGEEIESFLIAQSGLPLQAVFNQYLRQKEIPQLLVERTAEGFQYQWQHCLADFEMPVLLLIDNEPVWLQASTRKQDYYKPKLNTVSLHPEYYCDLELK